MVEQVAAGGEDAREESEVGEEIFGVVGAGTGVAAGGVVEDGEEGLFLRLAGQPGNRGASLFRQCGARRCATLFCSASPANPVSMRFPDRPGGSQ